MTRSAIRRFVLDVAERAAKTFAQTLATLLTAAGVGLIDAPWWASLSAAGMAGVLSVLTSVASAGVTNQPTGSAVSVAVTPPTNEG